MQPHAPSIEDYLDFISDDGRDLEFTLMPLHHPHGSAFFVPGRDYRPVCVQPIELQAWIELQIDTYNCFIEFGGTTDQWFSAAVEAQKGTAPFTIKIPANDATPVLQ